MRNNQQVLKRSKRCRDATRSDLTNSRRTREPGAKTRSGGTESDGAVGAESEIAGDGPLALLLLLLLLLVLAKAWYRQARDERSDGLERGIGDRIRDLRR